MSGKEIGAAETVKNYSGRKLRIMEVCGTHTHEIFRLGIRRVLPKTIELISGPGCPVCVTPTGYIDKAVYLAEKGVAIATFGDLLRVPGSNGNLADTRSGGSTVRIVYTPLDAVELAEKNPDRQFVFLSIGFETTVPASCLAVEHARKRGIKNFSLLTANKTMDEAYRALKGSADAFLYPGHVSAITGTKIYEELAKEGISGVVTGFTADEIFASLACIIEKTQSGEPFSANMYKRVVREDGSPKARGLMKKLMRPCDAEWRGLGVIKNSGLELNDEYKEFDAEIKFEIPKIDGKENPACRCGDILRGSCKPYDCPLFGKVCNPEHPVGSCMVSGEGSCSAFYKYGGALWKM